MNSDLTNLLVEAMGLLLTAGGLTVVRYVLPWLKGMSTEQQWRNAQIVAGHAVAAVEQITNGQGDNKLRFEAAKDRAQKFAKERGITISDAQLETLIEAAVLSMKQIDAAIEGPSVKGRSLPERDEHGRFKKKTQMGFGGD